MLFRLPRGGLRRETNYVWRYPIADDAFENRAQLRRVDIHVLDRAAARHFSQSRKLIHPEGVSREARPEYDSGSWSLRDKSESPDRAPARALRASVYGGTWRQDAADQ